MNNPVVFGEVGVEDPIFHMSLECEQIPADGVRPIYWSEAKERVMLPRLCEACGPFAGLVRPDIVDRFGRSWAWVSGSLYRHDQLAWTADMISRVESLPPATLASNPNYKLCSVCTQHWPQVA